MVAAIAAVCASVTLKSDFNKYSDYLSTFVMQKSTDTWGVASLEVNDYKTWRGAGFGGRGRRWNGRRGCGRGIRGGRVSGFGKHQIEDWYYSVEEYKKLSPEQKKKLYKIRQKKPKLDVEKNPAATAKLSTEVSNIASIIQDMNSRINNTASTNHVTFADPPTQQPQQQQPAPNKKYYLSI